MQRLLRLSLAISILVTGACGQTTVSPTTSVAETTQPLSRPDSKVPDETPDSTSLVIPTIPSAVSHPECTRTPGALQAIIDNTPDGHGVSDMKGKLVNAAELGFTVLDLSSDCFEGQGRITIMGRAGLWIVRPTTFGSDWYLVDSSDMVLSGLELNGGSLSISGGNQRIEAGEVHDLVVTEATDFMMGKMTVTGHAHFDTMRRIDVDKSFARNSDFNTVEVSGDIDGFKFENSTATSVVDNTDSATRLNLGGLVTH